MPVCPSCQAEVPRGNRFCGGCGRELPREAELTRTDPGTPETPRASAAYGGSTSAPHATSTPSVGRLSATDSLEPTRFAPGQVIGERYRIIGLLGRGGMGEVYRADDLKLGQPVALKFLPEALSQNDARLRRFLDEVRIARQVSHANVCRVYDIGEHMGQQHLSMEYVDGEDLATLIRRIGRLSEDKGLEIARQVCAGLAAAHAKGIVHRDLKPSNVMIDGEGRARITDFGLAGLARGFAGAEIRVGTPAYMAPEQLAGTEVTIKSDVYSLGLLLHELFTGKPVFKARTMTELTRERSDASTTAPRLTSSIDTRITRVIERCLEPDPARRPPSALAVLAALPGGDPLGAALEAGETPSPEMVADAGDNGGLYPGRAFGLFGLALLGVAGLVGLSSQFVLVRQFDLPKPPAALVVETRELIRNLGYEAPRADSLFGFGMDGEYEKHVKRETESPDRFRDIPRVRPSPLLFWYRESPRPLVASRASGSASFSNPPMTISGMVSVVTDEQGRLIDFSAVPDEVSKSTDTPADWSRLLAAAELDATLLAPAEPEWNPLVDCDQRAAWTGTYPGQPDVPVRVEAGSFAGKPVYFTVVAPWTRASRMLPPERGGAYASNVIVLVVFSAMVVGGVLLARRHVRRGRSDTRGAFVTAGYLFFVLLVSWLFHAHHVRSLEELSLFADALESGLFLGAMVWVIYVALEPYVRRQWPHALIGWSRLLVGRFRDPLVGRDLLLGSLAGVAVAWLIVLSNVIPRWFGHAAPPAAIDNSVGMLTGLRTVAGSFFSLQPGAMLAPIGVFFLIFVLRIAVRKQWIAIAVAFALMSTIQGLQLQQPSILGWVVAAAVWALLIFVIVRLGVLAAVISFTYANLLLSLPLTTDLSVWYFDRAAFGLLVLIALTSYGVYLSIAGRTVFADSLLQEA